MKGLGKIALLLALFVAAATVVIRGEGRTEAGGRWADFSLETPEGTTVALSEFVGRKAVLLVFWATWCPPCEKAVPAINRLQAELAPTGRLQVLALDFMESREKVVSHVRSWGIAYPVLLDRSGVVARRYGVVGIPTYIVITRDGTIAYRDNALPPDIAKYL